MEWRKELLLLLHFLLFFIFYRLGRLFFFISFFFIPPSSSSCNVKSHGSLHTHTESTVTGLISDRPAETLSEWLNGKRLSPLLSTHEPTKKNIFFSYFIFLLLAGWYQSIFFLISSDFIYFYFLIIRNFVRNFFKNSGGVASRLWKLEHVCSCCRSILVVR